MEGQFEARREPERMNWYEQGNGLDEVPTALQHLPYVEGAPVPRPVDDDDDDEDSAPAPMKYAEVSKAVQHILKDQEEPLPVQQLDETFLRLHGSSIADIVGMTTEEYLERKENIFVFEPSQGTVALRFGKAAGPPVADPNVVKDEAFVVKEFEQLIESMGPVVYTSALCGKFIQRNGVSVTSVIGTRPLDLFKRYPSIFLILGAGHVTLQRFEKLPEVSRLSEKPATSKAQRSARAADEAAALPVPVVLTEQHVVEEFRRLILLDNAESVYISSLCGRFLQRYKKPVTTVITCKPGDFLRRYPDIFVLTGGGNVGLREILGPDAVSVPPPPPRVPKAVREEQQQCLQMVKSIELSDEVLEDVFNNIDKEIDFQAIEARLRQVCEHVKDASFLALDEIVLSGAAGQGLVSNNPAAEIVCFVKQLPYKNFSKWLPSILDTLAPGLETDLVGLRADRFKVEKDHVRFFLASVGQSSSANVDMPAGQTMVVAPTPELRVKVYVSPVFQDSEQLQRLFQDCPSQSRHYLYPALAKERNELILRQPPRCRKVMRLLMWWSSKQPWSSAHCVPPDWLLQLTALAACRLCGSKEEDYCDVSLREQVVLAMKILSEIDRIALHWGNDGDTLTPERSPPRDDGIWFQDPTNPCFDVVSSLNFQPHELCLAAADNSWPTPFQKEAAKWLLRAQKQADGGDDHVSTYTASEKDDEEFLDAEDGLS